MVPKVQNNESCRSQYVKSCSVDYGEPGGQDVGATSRGTSSFPTPVGVSPNPAVVPYRLALPSRPSDRVFWSGRRRRTFPVWRTRFGSYGGFGAPEGSTGGTVSHTGDGPGPTEVHQPEGKGEGKGPERVRVSGTKSKGHTPLSSHRCLGPRREPRRPEVWTETSTSGPLPPPGPLLLEGL